MITIEAETIGEAWLETARQILRDGAEAVYDDQPTKELALVAIHVAAPDPDDATIARLADPEWLDWMRRNFAEPDDVAELGGPRSYALRLRDYGGRDQVAWVVERLADPECRAAATGNLVELARLQHEVAGAVGCPVGSLLVHANSAHVYEPELGLMGELTA